VTTVSVIICTRNRADSLAETLESVSRCELPAGWTGELLVVDNGSTDHTQRIVQAAPRGVLGLRTVIEPRRGAANARNRGIAETTGRIIAFTDDDVRVNASWLLALCAPIAQDDADAVQGMIVPAPHLRRPWIAGIYADALAVIEPGRAGEPQSLTSANIAFTRRVLERVPGFQPELGPGALGFGEDTLFGVLLSRAGYRLRYAHDAVVEHHFDASRLERAGFLEWAEKGGRSSAMMDVKWLGRPPKCPRLRARWVTIKCALRRTFTTDAGPVPPEWLLWYRWQIAYASACAEFLRSR
jgi:glucosyl-dolichyl phosphate glucuronosyltransferase